MTPNTLAYVDGRLQAPTSCALRLRRYIHISTNIDSVSLMPSGSDTPLNSCRSPVRTSESYYNGIPVGQQTSTYRRARDCMGRAGFPPEFYVLVEDDLSRFAHPQAGL